MKTDLFSQALNARVKWAEYRIALIACEGMVNASVIDLAAEAGELAFDLGFFCYPDSPMFNLISGTPELFQRWHDGYTEAREVTEMQHRTAEETNALTRCHGCNNGTGNPCLFHG